ncbi:MAG: hypothetical protein KDK36_21310, partial [Leptospiraceae bacterium]|nr:hypothetical protein [Leptospiraceae bacterium]
MKFILYIFILSFTFELSAQFTKDDIFSCTISYQIQCLDVGKEYLRRVREGESMDKDGFNKIRQINFYGLEDIKPEEFERLTEFKNLT